MTWLICFTIGATVAAAAYLIMQRRLIQLVLGLSLLSHATNLMLIASGWVGDGKVPIVPENGPVDPAGYVDPLPQAMILTAIVISFAVTAFLLVLAMNIYQRFKTDDIDRLRRLMG
ncbi:MAG: Na+/H+ antiporter subunit C [Candidatus Tectomicrobia bacterium]|uniref:Na+/H+ antiporter subunit C n=1 Tax=Tectimicrobiota bacterium TaxID=2528274 RepID=A0A932HXI0_UNCTE|nr:Na+/H+ antiporter subunit C [Candidatus Tectomicrobia bacterium]